MARDLQVRLILAHLAVTLVGLLLVGAVFAVLLNREVSSTHQRDLRNETQTLAHQLNRALARNARRRLMQRLISTDAQLTGKRVILLNSQGHVAYDSSRWTPLSAGSWRLLDIPALRRGTGTAVQHGNDLGFQSPLFIRGHAAGAVTLLLTASDTGTPWKEILPALLIVLPLLLLIWLAIGAHLARSMTRPLRQVSDALSVVGAGRTAPELPEEGWSEARELTRRYNEMVAEVARSDRMLRDFMANAAHELKTPAALVAGFARALADGTAQRGGAVEDAIATIRVESEHLAAIVEQLLTLASLEANANALRLHRCRPGVLIERVANRYRPRALQGGIELYLEIEPALPACEWDDDRMASALGNLVDNAIDHTQPGGSVTLSASQIEDAVRLEVKDTGCGVAAEEIPHLFERFYRGHGRHRQDGHAGLGLAMVEEVVRRHGGSCAVGSRLGEGTSFVLLLPNEVAGGQAPPEAVTA